MRREIWIVLTGDFLRGEGEGPDMAFFDLIANEVVFLSVQSALPTMVFTAKKKG